MSLSSVCIDANIAVAWLSWEQYTAEANALRRDWIERGIEMLAPSLFHAEVVSTIRRHVYSGRMLSEEGEAAFSVYLKIPVKIIDTPEVQRTAWELAKKFNQPVCYDMQYLAVAEIEDCQLWTADKKLADSLRNKTKRIRWIGEHRK